MTTSLDSPRVKQTLDRLFNDAHTNDPSIVERARDVITGRGARPDPVELAELLREAYLPVSRDVGRLLYILALGQRVQTIVEFGTSFGISTLFLAAALRDGGGGKVIATELHPDKVRKARQNLDEVGLGDFVEVREGDAMVTLRTIEGPIDFVLLDGWKNMYLPVLQLIEPHLRKGAMLVADNLGVGAVELRPYLEYVRAEGSGYVSVELPIGDKMELSQWHGRDNEGRAGA